MTLYIVYNPCLKFILCHLPGMTSVLHFYNNKKKTEKNTSQLHTNVFLVRDMFFSHCSLASGSVTSFKKTVSTYAIAYRIGQPGHGSK